MKEVVSLCRTFDVIGLLEVHGSRASLQSILGDACRSHLLFHSPFLENSRCRGDKGGVAILVSKALLGSGLGDPSFRILDMFQDIIPGRAARVAIPAGKNSSFACTFVHNHDLSSQQMYILSQSIYGDIRNSQASPPVLLVGMCLLGDFNIEARGEERFHFSSPDEGLVVGLSLIHI